MKNEHVVIICVILSGLLFIPTHVTSLATNNKEIDNNYMKRLVTQPAMEITSNQIEHEVVLLSPRSTAPIIIEHGTDFIIQFTADNFTKLFTYISTAYEPVVDEYWLTINDVSLRDEIWYANVTVPNNVYEELYNLTILLDVNGRFYECTQPRAVSIVDEITDDFCFVHITDFHVGDFRGFTENIRETIGLKSLHRCIHEINLLHPDFVIISGDLVYGQLYLNEYTREYAKCYELLQNFDVPTYLCPGNHDGYRRIREDGLQFWEEYFGPLYYSYDYGDYHFISVNSFDFPARLRLTISFIPLNWGGYIGDKQLAWIESDIAKNNEKNIIMFMHHTPLWDTTNNSLLRTSYHNREEILSLIDSYQLEMVLAGHIHYDTVYSINDTLFITTTTPSSSIDSTDGYWGYRLITIKNGNISSYNYKEPKYSIPSYNLQTTFQKKNQAQVTNDLEMNITALLSFVLPDNSYSVTAGSIIMERSNGITKQLYVTVEVEQQNQVIVKVTQDSQNQ